MNRLLYASAVLAMLVPSVASAVCSQADVAGKSSAYALAVSPTLGAFTVNCSLTVNNAGKVTGNCVTSLGINGAISSGSITLSNATKCQFKGSFTQSGQTATITSSGLSPNKQVLTGVGTLVDAKFLLTATKQ
jgi:hypothetical protein